jgi:hypothetical protein
MIAVLLAGATCTPGAEFAPRTCPPDLPPVAELVVERQGLARWQDAQDLPCATFRPTQADVRRFFRLAGEVDAREVHMTLPESACLATGRVRFADGGIGRWQVERYGLGSLNQPGKARVILYCRRCRSRRWSQ